MESKLSGTVSLPATASDGPWGLRQTIEAAPVGIAQFDAMGRFLLVNQRLCDIFGYARDDLVGRTFQEITFPEDLEGCLRRNAELAAGIVPFYRHQKRFVRADGSVVWVSVTVSAVREAKGLVLFFVGIAEDVTQERLERERRESAEARLAAALDASHTGTFLLDIPANKVWWDANLYRLFGQEPRGGLQDLGASMEGVHPDDREALARGVERCLTSGGRFNEEFRVVWPDGSVRVLRCLGDTSCDASGRPASMTGALTDITRLWQTQRELKNVVAVVAHDLRNPLQSLVMGVGVLARADAAESQREQVLTMMQRTLGGMDRLLTDLLDVSRVDAGTFAIEAKAVDVGALMQEVCDLFEERARRGGYRFACEVARALPSVRGDRVRLVQLLSNLVGNALKFTPPPGGIQVEAWAEAGEVRISVRDEGPGIAFADQQRLFERFWQRDPGRAGGAGLGLAIAKGIVDAHRGRIWVESEGHGATFQVALPVVQEA